MGRSGVALVLLLIVAGAAAGWWLLNGLGSTAPAHTGVARPADDGVARPGPARDAVADPGRLAADPAPERSAPRGVAGTPVSLGAPSETRQSVLGLVLSAIGPVPGAQVLLTTAAGDALAETTTDPRGNFEVAVPRPIEDALLLIRARGYTPLETGPHRVRNGEKSYLGNLRLTPGMMLAGRVVSPSGNALAGARVQLRAGGPGGGFNRYVQTATTDAQGSFRFPEAPRGMARVEAFAEGFGSRSMDFQHSSPTNRITLELVAELAMTVRVRDPDGAAVPGAKVMIRPSDPRSPEIEGVADEAGVCLLNGLGSTDWELRVSAPGYRPAIRPNARPGAEPIDVTLDPWPCISGRVTLPGKGAVPAGTTVLPLSANARGGFVDSGRYSPTPVAEDGSYTICDLRPGVYSVQASAPGFALSRSDSVRLTLSGNADNVGVELRSGGRLSVKVHAKKKPKAGTRVALYASPPPPGEEFRTHKTPLPLSPVQPLAKGVTDGEGLVLFDHLAEGQYWCLIRPDDLLSTVEGPTTVREGRTTEMGPIELRPGGRLTGTVTDQNAKPVRGAVVLLIAEGSLRGPIQVEADEEGRWASPLLPPAKYRLTARVVFGPPSARRTKSAEFVVKAGEEGTVDFEL